MRRGHPGISRRWARATTRRPGRRLLAALRAAGYDGVVSIEHEDPRYDGPEGTERSLDGLRRALATLDGA